MIIRVVGIREGVSFDTKDRRTGEDVHIEGTSVYFLKEARGVVGFVADKVFVSSSVVNPFKEVNKDYNVFYNEYGKFDLDHVTLA